MSSLPAVAARIVVRFASDATEAQRSAVVKAVGGAVDLELAALGLVRIAIPPDGRDSYGDGALLAETIAREPGVESAEYDATVRVQFTPNDQYYASDPYSGLGQWGIRKAQVDRAWDTVRSSPLTIAVVDTGVDPGHPDLAGALLPGRTFLSAPSAGCTVSERDDNSHGTHVTGIIAANGSNGIGIAGVAFGAKVLPLKALDCEGAGLLSDVARAIVFAADQGARIVSISLGSSSDSSTVRSAVQYAASRDVLVIIAAGNCGSDSPLNPRCGSLNEVSFPAAYTEALAVAATDVDDTRATFSTQGAYIDISAPGRRIVSTVPTYATKVGSIGYAAFSGTSQATPFVAGVAALVWSREPSLSAAQVRARLTSTADDLGPAGIDIAFGAGRVNALRAVGAAAVPSMYGVAYGLAGVPRTVVAGAATPATVLLTNASTFTWTAAGAGAVRLAYSWTDSAGTVLLTGPTTALAADVPPGATAALPFTLTAPARDGALTLRLDLVQDGVGAFSARGAAAAQLAMTVGQGRFGASYAPPASASAATVGVGGSLEVRLTNTGTLTWPATGATPVRLAYHWLDSAGRVLVWDGQRTVLPRDIAPGESVTVTLAYTPPATLGAHTLRLDLVREGVSWFSGLGIPTRDVAISVGNGLGAAYTVTPPPPVLAGGRILVPVTVRNSGTLTWRAAGANPVRLAAHTADASGATVRWDGERTVFAADVAPGASVTTAVAVAAPAVAGVYRVRIDLVQEGVQWFSGAAVATGDTFLTVLHDFRATLPVGTVTVSRAAPVVSVAVTNSGSATWTTGGAVPLSLASHWLDASGRVLVWDGPRAALTKAVAPGETLVMDVPVGPIPAGAAQLVIDVVADGLRWFGAGTARAVTLAP